MGNLCSISISIKDVTAPCLDSACRRPANYIRKLEQNQLPLGIAVGKLVELRNDLKRKVEVPERQQLKALDQVQGWLSRVEAVETAVTETEAANIVGSTDHDSCINNYRHKLGKKV